LRECDDIVVTEIKKAGLYTKIWQSFAVLLPVMSVGVMGDQRTYAYTCAVRAVHSEDGMTADWVPLPHEVLKTISSRIVNEVKGVTAWCTTSPRSRREQSSGSEAAVSYRLQPSARTRQGRNQTVDQGLRKCFRWARLAQLNMVNKLWEMAPG